MMISWKQDTASGSWEVPRAPKYGLVAVNTGIKVKIGLNEVGARKNPWRDIAAAAAGCVLSGGQREWRRGRISLES